MAISDREDTPLYARIAQAVVDGLRAGRFKAGDALPGSRSLAEQLRVHRNTVVAAYRELEAEGWVFTTPGQGTRISEHLPVHFKAGKPAKTKGFAWEAIPDSWDTAPRGPGMLDLGPGMPDVQNIPVDAIARAFRRALQNRRGHLLSYTDPAGQPRLRGALSQWLSETRGLVQDPERYIVTRGSQHGMDLVARTLFRPGDRVAVEAYGYPPAWQAFRLAGAEPVPFPVDEEGLCVDVLEASKGKFAAIYVTPHHQYPTTVSLSAPRRLQLLAFARKHRIPILEDDYDHEFHYQGMPILPLASDDPTGQVIYFGTLSKVLAPGLRMGFVSAHPDFIAQLARLRRATDRQGDAPMEWAVAEMLEEGEIQRHVRKMRRLYEGRRAFLAERLRVEFGDELKFTLPTGGIGLWIHAPGIDVERWREKSLELGVHFRIARQYAFDGKPHPWVRFGFAAHEESGLEEAVRRLRKAAWNS